MKLPSAALMIMTIGSLVGANAALAQATSQGALGANQGSTGGTNQAPTGGTNQVGPIAPGGAPRRGADGEILPMPNSSSAPGTSSSGVSGSEGETK